MEYNYGTSIITQYYKDPISGTNITKRTTEKQIINSVKNIVQLIGEPNEFERVQVNIANVDNMTEVLNYSDIKSTNQYYVDYNTGVVYFHPQYAGEQVELEYGSNGMTLIGYGKVFTKLDGDGNVVETLQDIIDLGYDAILIMKEYGNAKQVYEMLRATIQEARDVDAQLHDTISEALDTDRSINNKTLTVQTSDWTLISSGTYQGLYSCSKNHGMNSMNLLVQFWSSSINLNLGGVKLVDANNIELINETPVAGKVVLNKSYYAQSGIVDLTTFNTGQLPEAANYRYVNDVELANVRLIPKIVNDLQITSDNIGKATSGVYIEQFVGNDDNEKLQNAISVLSNGGELKFKSRTYMLDTFALPSNITIKGCSGTVLKLKQANEFVPFIHVKGSNVVVKDITIDDNGLACKGLVVGDFGTYTGSGTIENIAINNVTVNIKTAKNPGIQVGHGSKINIEGCKVTNYAKAGSTDRYAMGIVVHSDDAYSIENCHINNNTVDGFFGGIISWGTGKRRNIQISNNQVRNCYNIGIDMYHTSSASVSNNIIEDCTYGIYGDSINFNGNNMRGNIISGNQVYRCSKVGIFSEELRNGLIEGNTVQDCDLGICCGAGIAYTAINGNNITYNRVGICISNEIVPDAMQGYYNCDGVISGNRISYNKETAIEIRGGRGVWTISNNIITNNNTIGGDYYAILIKDDVTANSTIKCQNFVISDNTMHNQDYTSPAGYQKGIKNGGDYGFMIIKNNYFNNHTVELDLYYGTAKIVGNVVASYVGNNIRMTKTEFLSNLGM